MLVESPQGAPEATDGTGHALIKKAGFQVVERSFYDLVQSHQNPPDR
jgi:hypothetical protein